MSQKSIKISSELWQRVEDYAKQAGYSSPVEFVEHVLEKELAKQAPDDAQKDDAQKEIERRLRGLGYLE